jgi:PIN domain nuclease of toxin-antitoxin system
MIVLDTHTLVWWVAGQSELSKAAKNAIEKDIAKDEVLVSSISAWEIALLVEHGRLVLAMDVERWLRTVTQIRGLSFVAVDNEIAVKSVALVDFHKDPADRIIVATARELSASVVTKDERIRGYPHVKTIW